jgi:threonine synthase
VSPWRGLLDEYAEWLDLRGVSEVVTLLEGNTPLLYAERLSERVGAEVHLKLEGLNPTGSFKDRGMTMAITKAKAAGAESVVCGSTGNTSAAAAAYAARADMGCVVLVPEGKIALGKLAQAIVYGAEVVQVRGNFDRALDLARELTQHLPVTIVNSINPDRIEGQKTGAFEVVDALGDSPDILSIPVGNAGNISAYWRGFTQYHFAGRAASLPKMWGFQAAGAAPIVLGHRVEEPETVATAIRIGNPASWLSALEAVDESHGAIRAVSDDELLDAWEYLARSESVFCEPASAVSVAGLIKYGVEPGARVVCVLTGNGLKDPDTAVRRAAEPRAIDASIDALVAHLERGSDREPALTPG